MNTNTSAYSKYNCIHSKSWVRILVATGANSYIDKGKRKTKDLILEMKLI
jgi:hypothetical protein